MSTPAEIADWLRSTSFLEGFSDAHLWKLARHVTQEEFAPDETLFVEGQPRQRFAILVSGAVSIEKSSEGRTTRLVTLGAAGCGRQIRRTPREAVGPLRWDSWTPRWVHTHRG